MNIHELKYYENDEIWGQDFSRNPEERARLEATVSAVPAGTKSLLDVGCGNGSFLHALGDRVGVVHGVDRSETALSYVRVPTTLASADSLPFADKSFDVVTCLEVIEHLPQEVYRSALKEIARVARRWIVLGVPFDEDTVADRVVCPKCFCAFNRSYHLRSFNEQRMRCIWAEQNESFSLSSLRPVGRVIAYPGLNFIKKVSLPLRRPSIPVGVVCPQCGHSCSKIDSSNTIVGADRKTAIRRFWPKKVRPRWFLGVYSRRAE